VRNAYERPEQLGADRWAALIGARSLHPGSTLVVMAGTATTVDLLDGQGLFRGGLILPGLDLMRRSLARNTAQLDLLPGEFRDTPTNTADAIFSGCLSAQAGAVERMFQHIAAEPDALCLLSGGAALHLLPLLRIPVRPVENLVLEGLARIGQEHFAA
jgi:type III pantothenate kinase